MHFGTELVRIALCLLGVMGQVSFRLIHAVRNERHVLVGEPENTTWVNNCSRFSGFMRGHTSWLLLGVCNIFASACLERRSVRCVCSSLLSALRLSWHLAAPD